MTRHGKITELNVELKAQAEDPGLNEETKLQEKHLRQWKRNRLRGKLRCRSQTRLHAERLLRFGLARDCPRYGLEISCTHIWMHVCVCVCACRADTRNVVESGDLKKRRGKKSPVCPLNKAMVQEKAVGHNFISRTGWGGVRIPLVIQALFMVIHSWGNW